MLYDKLLIALAPRFPAVVILLLGGAHCLVRCFLVPASRQESPSSRVSLGSYPGPHNWVWGGSSGIL